MPARQPTALKRLKGTLRPGRENKAEPKPSMPDGVPHQPCWLNPTATAIWFDLAPKVRAMRVLTDADLDALANLCIAQSMVRDCTAAIARDGMTVQSPRSAPMPHPAIRVQREYLMIAKSLMVEFGLTPASRGRLSVEPQKTPEQLEEERRWDEFLAECPPARN